MKNILLLLILCGAMASCTGNDRFTIKGTLGSSFYGDSIYLCTASGVVDTLASGSFSDSTTFVLEGESSGNPVVFLKTSTRKTTPYFILENGEIRYEELNDTLFLATGTPLNDIYSRFLTDNCDVRPDSVRARKKRLMIEHSSDALGLMLGRMMAYGLEAGEYVELYDRMDSLMRRDSFFVKIYRRSIRQVMSVGSMFSEVIGEIDGKPARLSEYAGRGSWVLLSFWASWCGDCARVMPRLRNRYDALKEAGVQVLGISCRDNPEPMKKAMEKYDMRWPVFCNAKGRETYSYGVVTIPHFVLIDPDGVIAASGTLLDEVIGKIPPGNICNTNL